MIDGSFRSFGWLFPSPLCLSARSSWFSLLGGSIRPMDKTLIFCQRLLEFSIFESKIVPQLEPLLVPIQTQYFKFLIYGFELVGAQNCRVNFSHISKILMNQCIVSAFHAYLVGCQFESQMVFQCLNTFYLAYSCDP